MNRQGFIVVTFIVTALLGLSCSFVITGPATVDKTVAESDFTAIGTSGVSTYSFTATEDAAYKLSVQVPMGATSYFFVSNTSASTDHEVVVDVSYNAKSIDGASDTPLRSPSAPIAIRGLPESRTRIPGLFDASASRALGTEAPPRRFDTVGATDSLYMMSTGNADVQMPSTCRAVLTANGITLNVYVTDEDWNTLGAKISQTMVDTVASQFLASDTNDDIYEWITGIYGLQWPSSGTVGTGLIAGTDQITILIGDISDDKNPNGGIVGYFWSVNNMVKKVAPAVEQYSNERIMFVLDSYMLANPAGGTSNTVWEASDPWPEDCYATLAHEFQHMINFYQKTVLSPTHDYSDTWLDEMCSAMAEDFVASKLGIAGPRGWSDVNTVAGMSTTAGRLPLFAYYPEYSLTKWGNGEQENYSQVYAFGAWLARNYGGFGLFREIVQNEFYYFDAVTEAIKTVKAGQVETPLSLFTQWGISCLTSMYPGDAMPDPYCYNAGMAVATGSYLLGPINLNRYRYYYSTSNPALYSDGFFIYSNFANALPNPSMSNVYFGLPQDMATNVAEGTISLKAGQTLTVVAVQ